MYKLIHIDDKRFKILFVQKNHIKSTNNRSHAWYTYNEWWNYLNNTL